MSVSQETAECWEIKNTTSNLLLKLTPGGRLINDILKYRGPGPIRFPFGRWNIIGIRIACISLLQNGYPRLLRYSRDELLCNCSQES